MMRVYVSIFVVVMLLFFVCCQNSTETTTDSYSSSSSTTSTIPSDQAEVYFSNLSDYDVNVYVETTPIAGTENCTVRKKSSNSIRLLVSPFDTMFYFEYLIPVGNTTFPSYSGKADTGYKTLMLEGGKTQKINIESITQSETDSAFLLVENKSDNDCYLMKGIKSINPVGKKITDYTLHNGQSGVYEINDRKNTQIESEMVEYVKIKMNLKDLSLPITSVEKGMIYTMVVTADSVNLKSITPFNIDIQNQIWNRTVDADTYNVQCVRQNSSGDGIIVISTGVNQRNTIQCDFINKYGDISSSKSFSIGNANSVTVYDCMQNDDGNLVMLMHEIYDDRAEAHLISYNFESQSSTDYKFDTDYSWVFRKNMQNSIIQTADGVYAVVGGRISSSNVMNWFLSVIDTSDADNITCNMKLSDETSDYTSGVEMMLTSVYFDGTDYIACGYENCDFRYGDLVHSGVVYRFSGNLSTSEKVYSKDNTLLFGIVGKDNHYWACGEYADTGKILKGCLVCDSTSDMQLFTSELSYHWFNQIAISGDKLLLCGPTSDNMNGSGTAYSVVTATDQSGNAVWSNTFTDYSDALSCIPNGIGSYIVQLQGENKTVIVSADLLGGNTGKSKRN